MHVKEEDVLVPRKPSSENPDDWPTFNLRKVSVTSQKTGKDVSLLSANHKNPVKVTGKLEKVEDGLLHLVREKKYRDKTLEIGNVVTYAFAEFEDGTYGFWAAGKAGWFDIQSAANAYQERYNKMNEAASIFFLLADKLRRARNRRPKLNRKALNKYANRTFQDYLGRGVNPIALTDVDDVREIFHEHREFLITSMLQDHLGLGWEGTPMLTYFTTMFPDDVADIEARLFGKTNPIEANVEDTSVRPRKQKSQSSLEDLTDRSKKRRSDSPQVESGAPKKRRRGRPRSSEAQSPKTPPTNSADTSSSDEIYGNSNVVSRKRKSILRPSGGKSSKKATGRRKGPAAILEPHDGQQDDDDENSESPQEEIPIMTLRNGKELELLTNPPRDRTPDPDDPPSPKFLPRKYLELQLVKYDVPSTAPQGPGDLWTCSFEGCFHRVHEASAAEGWKRIEEHFQTHTASAQEKIDLVLSEGRPYLPVNNLVRRLQAFATGPDVQPGPDSLERIFAAPIRKRY